MNSDSEKYVASPDTELEREIRQRRKFSAQEAIGRLAGEGAMKGGSAISLQRQAENAIGSWLRNHVDDVSGALRIVLQRQLEGSELLLENLDQPLVALAKHCERLRTSDHLLKELVRECDVEWGRTMDERPYFEREGAPSDPNDPYTIAKVRCALLRLAEQLEC